MKHFAGLLQHHCQLLQLQLLHITDNNLIQEHFVDVYIDTEILQYSMYPFWFWNPTVSSSDVFQQQTSLNPSQLSECPTERGKQWVKVTRQDMIRNCYITKYWVHVGNSCKANGRVVYLHSKVWQKDISVGTSENMMAPALI